MTFAVGSLVRARGREWVVLPETQGEKDLLVLRPLGGTDEEVTGIYVGPGPDGSPFEHVESAEIKLPKSDRDLGNHLSCGLLRDAVRLGFRSAAGPFRSLARIAVEPRPYQLVPLLLALSQDPVRMLIADDVGIGKTIEACLIARELYDRGEIRRFTVLCPPHLAEQWQKALYEQFHFDAALILPGTAARLERASGHVSLFDRYPFTVLSTDFIKQERRRDELLRSCPELVIVDEAHTCAESSGRGAAQKRYALLRDIAKDPDRHLILVTATPHSGKPETFRSLLALLDPSFRDLPEDLSGEVNRPHRERLAPHLVQRRRGDIRAYQDIITPFPTRDTAEETYSFKPAYRKFLQRLAAYCNESVKEAGSDKRRRRVRWWSALALLRALSSSPAAAAATLRNRSSAADADTEEGVDEEGQRAVLDLDDESAEGLDAVPGAGEDADEASAERRRLLDLARDAEKLAGREDAKLLKAAEIVATMVAEGRAPIVFCRFIPTVDYVAEALREKLAKDKDVTVEAITGLLPPEERESRVEALSQKPKRVLVCTDCLSEGINLQHAFDTVIHYDLAWNPTRHEQREGRVDRYGQPVPKVRALTYFGRDNPVDGVVLEVLLRKHKNIRDQLGIAVPIPMDADAIEEAMQGILQLKDPTAGEQLTLFGPKVKQLDILWNAAVDREKRSRAIFAHSPLEKSVNDQIFKELAEVRSAIGGDVDVERFTLTALRSLKATVLGKGPFDIDLRESPAAVRDALGEEESLRAVFRGQPARDTVLLTRTHPVVEGLSSFVLQTALDPQIEAPARRAGVVRTSAVTTRTTVLLARFRFHLVGKDREGREQKLLAEDLVLTGFRGSPDSAEWLPDAEIEPLLSADPSGNIAPDLAREQLSAVIERFDALRGHLVTLAQARAKKLLEAHQRVRKILKTAQRTTNIDAHESADVLGVFVYLPAGGAK